MNERKSVFQAVPVNSTIVDAVMVSGHCNASLGELTKNWSVTNTKFG